jgi:glycosyltransferase involved in cell wall biosynthesis
MSLTTNSDFGDASTSAPSAATKLCFFSSLASFDSGMPICTFMLIAHFAKNPSYEVHAIFPEQGEFTERLKKENVRVAVIPFARLRAAGHVGAFLRFSLGWCVSLIKMAGYIKRNRIALVHFSDFIDAPFYPAAKWAGAAVVAHLRLCIEKPLRRRFYSLWAAIFTDKTICISRAVQKFSGLSRRRADIVLDPGPDYFLFDPLRLLPPEPALDKSKTKIMTIAKFLWVKGHDYFVRMAVLVEKAMPGAVQFVIIGDRQQGHQRFYDTVMDLMRDAGMEKSIAVIGQVRHEEIPGYLQHTDIFVHLPRYQEGLGGVVCEAMAMGVPVVAFNSGGVGECFRDNQDGFLVKQFDVEAAAEKVVLLARNKALRKSMGKSGLEYVREKFSLESHVASVEKVYRTVLRT